MATPAQNLAATTAAIQAAAIADLPLLNGYASANGSAFVAIETSLGTLAGNMSSNARTAEVLAIQTMLAGALAAFNTLVSTTTAAQTVVPVA